MTEGVCPFCFARAPLGAFLADAAARRALAQALRCRAAPGHLVLAYLDCFRPPKRSLSWSRAERLLGELADAMERGAIRRKRRDWPLTDALWREALGIVMERRDSGRLQTPLRDHAYLWEVLVSLSHRAEGAEERRIETARRNARPARGYLGLDGRDVAGLASALVGDGSGAPPEERGQATPEERAAAYREGLAAAKAILGTTDAGKAGA